MTTIGKEPISLYIHVPFCKKKCPYCHFFVLKENEKQKDLLMAGLLKELLLYKIDPKNPVVSIYFGGGTPSLMGPDRIKSLLEFIKLHTNCENLGEITLEVNPDDIDFEKAKAFYEAGINRVSIGVQSLDDASLKIIQRTHGVDEAIKTIFHFYNAGIQNISIDLMYDRPHQTLEVWQKELSTLKDLPITHLSLYNMTIEEGSAYKRQEAKIKKMQPDDVLSLSLYQEAINSLEKLGFERYEISAFCRNGKRSIHNLGYWQGRDFYGLGPSSFSYVNKRRFQNVCSLKKYLEYLSKDILPQTFEERLDDKAILKEMLCIGLRVKEGIHLTHFQEKYGLFEKQTLESIEELIQKDLISRNGEYLFLTPQGMLFFNEVGSSLI